MIYCNNIDSKPEPVVPITKPDAIDTVIPDSTNTVVPDSTGQDCKALNASTETEKWADIVKQFQEGIERLTLPEPYYCSYNNKYLYLETANKLSNEDYTDHKKFRINLNELQAFFIDNSNNDNEYWFSNDYQVENNIFWSICLGECTPEKTKLFLYPYIDDEVKFIKQLKYEDIISIAPSNHGVIYIIYKDQELAIRVLDHKRIKLNNSPSSPEIKPLDLDLNDDGYNDYEIYYTNGYKQELYYHP